MKSKLLLIILIFGIIPILGFSQEDTDTLQPKKPVVFREKKSGEFVRTITLIGLEEATNGWNIGISLVRSDRDFLKEGKYSVFGISFGYIRNLREVSQKTNFYQPNGISGSVKFGKANSLYPIEFSYGKRIPLGQEAVYKGIEVTFEYKGGLLLGVQVPYPIVSIFGQVDEYNPETAIYYKDFQNIQYSPGSFGQFSFKTIVPGIRAAGNLCFTNLKAKKLTTTIDVGASLDFYSRSIPLYWNKNSGPLFFQVHLGAQIGLKKES